MKTYPIPAASVQRLLTAQQQFEQLASMIAEAMGIDPDQRVRLDLQNKQFVLEDETPANGVVESPVSSGT